MVGVGLHIGNRSGSKKRFRVAKLLVANVRDEFLLLRYHLLRNCMITLFMKKLLFELIRTKFRLLKIFWSGNENWFGW